jgi:UDP-glucose:(heptosyl)LPS alpha-1,3-glucosyltransferase
LYDPFANVTVEALAMGLWVLSSRRNGGSEVLTAAAGEVVEAIENPQEMAEALDRATEHPKGIESAQTIRQSVSHLDFRLRLNRMVTKTLQTLSYA